VPSCLVVAQRAKTEAFGEGGSCNGSHGFTRLWRAYPWGSIKKTKSAMCERYKEEAKMAECPVCGAEFTLSPGIEEGEIISCEDCGSDLEVTGEDSVEEAPQEEEDWGE
jgi:alpha-aminoadipate carrier protein LysW